MQTPPFDAAALQAACKKALTSAAFNKFLTQAVQTVMDDAQAQPEGIVLPVMTGPRKVHCMDHVDGMSVVSADTLSEATYYRDRDQQQGKPPTPYWWGCEIRVDTTGRRWSSQLPRMVQDDFGNLVAVAQ